MKDTYVVLLLDKDCHVADADFVCAELPDVVERARKMAKAKRAWGYELWHHSRKLVATYDCKHPPARVAVPSS